MPTNEQRRATAKRKLERQLEHRAKLARRRKILTIAGVSMLAVAVIAGGVVFFVMNKDSGDDTATAGTPGQDTSDTAMPTAAPLADGKLPPFTAGKDLGANCQYPAAPQEASKKVDPPKTGRVPTDPAQVSVSMETNQGNIGLQLDNAKSPCTVNSFASLAEKEYFSDTPCHRLTTTPGLSVLQCGDPSGTGSGGPGYQFGNEYPTDQYPPGDPALQKPVTYPRGTLAMANAGPGTNGSQFFLVYKDSLLPPGYTVFGTIDETGLATLDKIAEAGVAGGQQDGKPVEDVSINTVRLD